MDVYFRWTGMIMAMGFHWIRTDTYVGMYDQAKLWVVTFQTLAIVEVLTTLSTSPTVSTINTQYCILHISLYINLFFIKEAKQDLNFYLWMYMYTDWQI